jgi:RNA polymerase sigma-70 factor, ECF subfamily
LRQSRTQDDPFSAFLKRFMNNRSPKAVFMFEDTRLVAEGMVSPAIAMPRTDEDELELVVREHARLVYRIAYAALRNHHDAEDATQETFLRVMRYRQKLAEVRELKTWLARIAWRVALGRRGRVREVGWDDVSETVSEVRSRGATAEEMVQGNQLGRVLQDLMAALPEKLRDPLTLSTLEDLTSAEIAEVLGTNEAAVRSRIFRARQILRQKLAVRWEGKHGT